MALTDEQQPIVDAPPSARLLVTAGPGTGKTHTLIARLGSLVEVHGLAAGAEILVLTFSRAAVREIRNRVASTDNGARYVRARTFDSFATRLLDRISPNGPWSKEGYDGRIRFAADAIRILPMAGEILADYAHVLVDEIQDLVGERAELVKTILEKVPGGFTLLGDPAQGIYNFQLEDPEARRIGSAAIFQWLRKRFKSDLKEYTLTINHRAQTSAAKTALWAGFELNKPNPPYESIKERLETNIAGLPTTCDISEPVTLQAAFRPRTPRTAVLCYDNGQALMVSRELHEAGIAHILQREAVDRVIPAWLAVSLLDLTHKQLAKTAFQERAQNAGLARADAESHWRLLKRIDSNNPNSLDVGILAERMRAGDIPDDLCEQPTANLVVSTIHRAKGLEFDRVLIIPSRRETEDAAETARVVYVAMTRPKRDLGFMRTPDFKGVFLHKNTDRWHRAFGWKVNAIEVRGDDVDREFPAGAFQLAGYNAAIIQKYIIEQVKPSDPVTLKRLPIVEADGQSRVFYAVEHKSRTVGVTSESFSSVLFRILKRNSGWKVTWPTSIDQLRVEVVDTVAGTEAASKRAGLGCSGFWLRVRVSGLGFTNFATG